ncbi:MAG: carbohydrate porin [Pseudomonadota bacterium]
MSRVVRRLPLSVALAALPMSVLAAEPVRENTSPAATPAPSSLWDKPALLEVPGGPREQLREAGIDIELRLTQFYQSVFAGDGSDQWEYSGKLDAIATVNLSELGLWRGLFVNVHQEVVWGDDVNFAGDGSLIPLNTAIAFPRLGGEDHDTSITVTQVLGPGSSISLGKFNLLEAASKTPLLGGGGQTTFMNLGLAAPISGVTPPYILGAIGTVATEAAIFTGIVYDPRNAQDSDVLEDPFSDGVTLSGQVTFPTEFGGLPGFYAVQGVYSSAEGFDLARIPQAAALPPESAAILTQEGYWYFSASAQQFLQMTPEDPTRGWGVFGKVGISDGNPNVFQWSVLAGLGGASPIPGRSQDNWGIAYFRYGLSDDLLDGLATIGIDLQDEQGIEAYYAVTIAPWLQITADIQWIDPHEAERDDAWVAGLRARTHL